MREKLLALAAFTLLASAGCGSDDPGCHEGLWIKQNKGSDVYPGSKLFDYLNLRSDGVSVSLGNAAVCDSNILYLDSDDLNQRKYSASDTELVLLENSQYYEIRGLLICEGDQMTTTEAYPGNWTRATGAEGSAVAALFGLKCDRYWQACYGGCSS